MEKMEFLPVKVVSVLDGIKRMADYLEAIVTVFKFIHLLLMLLLMLSIILLRFSYIPPWGWLTWWWIV